MGCISSSGQGVKLDKYFLNSGNIRTGLVWQRTHDIEKFYEIVGQIGQGSMAAVSIVKKRRKTSGDAQGNTSHETKKPKESMSDKFYALKTIFMNRVSKALINEILNEIEILRTLHHPNIIQLLEVYYHRNRIYLVMEFCEGGHLPFVRYTEDQTCHIVRQILHALTYMHDNNVTHRDLKLENIVMTKSDQMFPQVKLIDFGLSSVFTGKEKMRKFCGTVYTMAPEVFSGQGYTNKADLWSVGCIVFVMLSTKFPFLKDEKDLENQLLLRRLMDAKYYMSDPVWNEVSEEAKYFISKLLRRRAATRFSAMEALKYLLQEWAPKLKGSRASIGRIRALPSSLAKSMLTFSQYGELRKAALMLTAFNMKTDELQELQQAFHEVDTENTGTITYDELKNLLVQFGISNEEEMKKIFGSIDQDQSGKVHYMEFLAATVEARGLIDDEELFHTFQRLDADQSGYITKSNLKRLLGTQFDEAKAARMIKEADKDGDDKISFEEFKALMKIEIQTLQVENLAGQLIGSTEEEAEQGEELPEEIVNGNDSIGGDSSVQEDSSIFQNLQFFWGGAKEVPQHLKEVRETIRS